MPIKIKAKLEGLDAVLKRLNHLKKQGKRNAILRKALNKAASPILSTAKRLSPKQTGLLRRSLGRKTWTRGGSVSVILGPRKGFKAEVLVNGKTATRDPIRYAHLVEFGRGKSRPRAFLRGAWDAHRSQAQSTVARIVLTDLEQLALKG